MEHEDQVVNYFQPKFAFAVHKYLEGKTYPGFWSRQTPDPTVPGSSQEQAGSLPPPPNQLLVAQHRYFPISHNLGNGGELTICLLMLGLEAANERALLNQAPAKAAANLSRIILDCADGI